MLDPDTGVRGAVQLLFGHLHRHRLGLRRGQGLPRGEQLTFPGRHHGGPRAGELYFKPLTHDQVLNVLHNPAYAGAYAYGRARPRHRPGRAPPHRRQADRRTGPSDPRPPSRLPHLGPVRGQPGRPGRQRRRPRRGPHRRARPAKASALLQGLVVCGRCGRRMTVRYHTRADRTRVPAYVCQNDGIRNAQPICQHLTGASIDAASAALILRHPHPARAARSPSTVTDELAADARKADTLRAAHVQRAQNAADTAQRRYLAVDPANRLVADTLEADWNTRAARTRRRPRRLRPAPATPTAALDEDQQRPHPALAADFPALWNDPATPMRERKRLLRLLITDVTLTRGQRRRITAADPLPRRPAPHPHPARPAHRRQHRKTPSHVTELIDQLLDDHTFDQIAGDPQRARATPAAAGTPWDVDRVANLAALCHARGLGSHDQRLRDRGHAHPRRDRR